MPLPTRRHLALNLLMTQVFTAHSSLAAVAEIGHPADAATLARRILELTVRMHYIGAVPAGDAAGAMADDRADTYLGFLWRELPPWIRVEIPASAREPWEAADARLTALKTKKHLTWKETFAAAGMLELYEGVYTLLSVIAHGSPLVAPVDYSANIVPLRGSLYLEPVIRAANNYAVNAARVWNDAFAILDVAELDGLTRETVQAPDAR